MLRRTERRTHGRNQNRQQSQYGKQEAPWSVRSNWILPIHACLLTLPRCSYFVNNALLLNSEARSFLEDSAPWWHVSKKPRPSKETDGEFFLIGKNLVGLARFELATTGLGNRCSIHLSYSPAHRHYITFCAVRSKTLDCAFTANQWGEPRVGAVCCVVSGCNPGATLSRRRLLKMLGQYSLSRLLAAPKPIRMP